MQVKTIFIIKSKKMGSIWIAIVIAAAISCLFWTLTVTYKKFQEVKLLEQQVRGVKLKNDSIEEILEAQRGEINIMIRAEIEFIQTIRFKENAPENIERMKKSIETSAELINKGAEINPALINSENISNLFPNTRKIFGL